MSAYLKAVSLLSGPNSQGGMYCDGDMMLLVLTHDVLGVQGLQDRCSIALACVTWRAAAGREPICSTYQQAESYE